MFMLFGNMITQVDDFELRACCCEICEEDDLRCSYEKGTDSFVVGNGSMVHSERAVRGLCVVDVMLGTYDEHHPSARSDDVDTVTIKQEKRVITKQQLLNPLLNSHVQEEQSLVPAIIAIVWSQARLLLE